MYASNEWGDGVCTVCQTIILGRIKTHKGINQRSKYAKQVQQQRPESPAVTLTRHACKYKVHKLHQRYILFIILIINNVCVCSSSLLCYLSSCLFPCYYVSSCFCFLALFAIHHLFHSYSVDLVKTQQQVITITNYSALSISVYNKNNNDGINVKDEE